MSRRDQGELDAVRLTDHPRALPAVGRQAMAGLRARQRELWTLAVVLSVADLLLTVLGLHLGLVERNPVPALVLDWFGVAGLLGLKALALAVGGVCWWLLSPSVAPVVPLGLSIPTYVAVLVNASLMGALLG